VEDNAITENVSESSDGGGMACYYYSSSVLSGNTISGNVASLLGGGIYIEDACTLTVTNSILWGDSAYDGQEVWLAGSSMISFSYSDVEGGTLGIHVDPACSLHLGPGNIDDDPLFVPASFGDYCLSQIAAGQGEDSPCVDAGDQGSGVPEGWTRTDGYPDIWPVDMGYHYLTNSAPDLIDQADTTIAEGQNLTFTLYASDPDEDSIAFSSPDLPDGATLDAVTGVFDWTPTYLQAGVYTVTFIATDYGAPAFADTEQTGITVTNVVSVGNGEEGTLPPPAQYLAQNYPNPFASSTTLSYSLRARKPVSLAIYDIRGAMVRELVHETVGSGVHRVVWDGRDSRGRDVGSGIYFCRLEEGEFTETKRMVLLR
jgi:hypothetical protein